jgi:aryl-alcohol dehydrogenase-like predicted oxidoreductase
MIKNRNGNAGKRDDVALTGYATAQGTRRYHDRMVASGVAHPEHFKDGLDGLSLSSTGLGTYLGGHDALTDGLYFSAIKQALVSGCNVVDSAINYRCMRSERVIGAALSELTHESTVARDEILISTKGGFIPYDGIPPRDPQAYLQQAFVMPGIMQADDVVAECHCMAPAYLQHQLKASLSNLGLSCIDVYYLHNPELQLDHISPAEFRSRMREAFAVLETAVAQQHIRVYGTATWEGYRTKIGSRGHLSLETLVKIAEEVGGKDHHFKAIQLPYNLGMPEALSEQTQTLNGSPVSFLEAAKALGLYVMASAAIFQGQLTRALPDQIREGLGAGTDAQRSIQFVRSTPGMGTALIGMKQADHVRENLAVAARAPLSYEQFATLFQ